ncbi:MAG: type II secretion system protein J [Syntrophobacteraceae bacterium]
MPISILKKPKALGSAGFTLLELVLATLISSLVIGMLSVAFGLSLRLWERLQNQHPSDMPAFIDLLKWQMASFDPVLIRVEDESKQLFEGDEHSLILATDHSVKAISKGAPVVARYQYSEKDKKLFYAEIPLDPYHADLVNEFINMTPSDNEKSWPRFYSTDAEEFSFAYGGGEDKEGFENSWQGGESPPALVMVKWSPEPDASRFVDLIIPNFLFPREPNETVGTDGGRNTKLQNKL